ncbi:MAG: heterodisulfide reductase subunit A-like protein [Candidatus Margulisbacteria bacterium]|nr:heterodisulfide reductase subunit A-like protein [Candidatus Margulisiibacteriota bacterium]
MVKKGLIMCVCQGTCPSFKKMDIIDVLNRVRKEKIVDFVSLHPQLCAEDGDQYLRTLLANKDIERLYVAACDPIMQQKMFRESFEAIGFDKSKHEAIDIRNMTTEEAVSAIKEMVSKKP